MDKIPKLPEGMILKFTSPDGWSQHELVRADHPCFIPAKKPEWGGYIRRGQPPHRVMWHRWAWEQVHGPIPKGMVIDHLCLNKSCSEVTHLECVTHQVNNLRFGVLISHCPQGHEYNSENSKRNKLGRRVCLVCLRAKSSERHYAKPGMGCGKGGRNKGKTECPNCGGPYSYRTGKESGQRRCMACYNRQHAEKYHTPEGRARQAEYTARHLAKKAAQFIKTPQLTTGASGVCDNGY